MRKHYKLNLQFFSEEESGVEFTPAAEVDTETKVASDTAEQEVTVDAEKTNNIEKAFAKRLAAKEAEWEAKVAEKYKDYDTHKELSEFFQERNGVDAMTLKEQIELEKLQLRAESNETTPEMQKRLEILEAKAARGDELEQQHIKEQNDKFYWSAVEKFVEGKDISKENLSKFMIDNKMVVDLSDPEGMNRMFEFSFKAMDHDNLVQKLGSAEKDGMKKLIQSKGTIATIPNKSAQGQVVSPAPKTWADARARAMQRD